MIRVSKGQFFKQALLYCTKINAIQLPFECFRGHYFSELVQRLFAKYPFDTLIILFNILEIKDIVKEINGCIETLLIMEWMNVDMMLHYRKPTPHSTHTADIIHIHIIEFGEFNQGINGNTCFAKFIISIGALTDI